MVAQNGWPVFDLCEAKTINLTVCLDHGGQSFTWIQVGEGEWVNVLGKDLIVVVGQKDGRIYFKVECANDKEMAEGLLRDYFRLDEDLPGLYAKWARDLHFKEHASRFPSLRLLRQDPVETLFAFICSQNNGIPRITKMVQHLRRAYGKQVGTFNEIECYSFPSPTVLVGDGMVEELNKAGFGYRSKYIQASAKILVEDNIDLWALRSEPYEDVVETLLRFPGIGPKVADCIALMSLDKFEAVPIDTHIWKVAVKNYKFVQQPSKSMTRAVYKQIGDKFRQVFGEKAGWAHLVLFASQSRK